MFSTLYKKKRAQILQISKVKMGFNIVCMYLTDVSSSIELSYSSLLEMVAVSVTYRSCDKNKIYIAVWLTGIDMVLTSRIDPEFSIQKGTNCVDKCITWPDFLSAGLPSNRVSCKWLRHNCCVLTHAVYNNWTRR